MIKSLSKIAASESQILNPPSFLFWRDKCLCSLLSCYCYSYYFCKLMVIAHSFFHLKFFMEVGMTLATLPSSSEVKHQILQLIWQFDLLYCLYTWPQWGDIWDEILGGHFWSAFQCNPILASTSEVNHERCLICSNIFWGQIRSFFEVQIKYFWDIFSHFITSTWHFKLP